MSKKPTVLMILDGYGLNENKEANAVAEAKTPVMDKLMKECPFVKCCKERSVDSCSKCPGYPCKEISDYQAKYVNKCNQL